MLSVDGSNNVFELRVNTPVLNGAMMDAVEMVSAAASQCQAHTAMLYAKSVVTTWLSAYACMSYMCGRCVRSSSARIALTLRD